MIAQIGRRLSDHHPEPQSPLIPRSTPPESNHPSRAGSRAWSLSGGSNNADGGSVAPSILPPPALLVEGRKHEWAFARHHTSSVCISSALFLCQPTHPCDVCGCVCFVFSHPHVRAHYPSSLTLQTQPALFFRVAADAAAVHPPVALTDQPPAPSQSPCPVVIVPRPPGLPHLFISISSALECRYFGIVALLEKLQAKCIADPPEGPRPATAPRRRHKTFRLPWCKSAGYEYGDKVRPNRAGCLCNAFITNMFMHNDTPPPPPAVPCVWCCRSRDSLQVPTGVAGGGSTVSLALTSQVGVVSDMVEIMYKCVQMYHPE